MSLDATGHIALGPITGVTVTAPDLAEVADCYARYLGYRVHLEGTVPRHTAQQWGCPDMTGRSSLTLVPEVGEDFWFRFIQAEADAAYVPFATYGWNAAELIVRDVDRLADRLANSPFRIIGEPANLSFSDDIRAMQVLGPGHELLYLTEFKKPVPGLDVPTPRCDVDRTFIVILGGPSLDALQDFYAERFGVPRATPVESRVKGMSAAFGLSPEHRYPIAALPLAGQCLIEVDQMPPQARARDGAPGSLPAGISVVSFGAGRPGAMAEPDCMRGPAGELIEVA